MATIQSSEGTGPKRSNTVGRVTDGTIVRMNNQPNRIHYMTLIIIVLILVIILLTIIIITFNTEMIIMNNQDYWALSRLVGKESG